PADPRRHLGRHRQRAHGCAGADVGRREPRVGGGEVGGEAPMIIDEQALLRLIDERVERALAERQPPEETMFKHEVASLLDVSERTVTNYMREGLPHRYRGRTPVFLR